MDQAELTPAFVEVHLDVIRRNSERLAARAGVPIIAMLKADAYGLGAVPVARALRNASHVWGFGVATVAEGVALRRAGVRERLLCCTPLLPAELPGAYAANITPALAQAADIVAWAKLGEKPWHLSIDTGMNRAGVPWNEVERLRETVTQHPPEGAFTHHAAVTVADGSRALQDQRFDRAVERCRVRSANPGVLLHVDSSLGLAARAPTPYNLARPGIALYGWPAGPELGVTPAFCVRAPVVDVRMVPAGERVSYGGTWTAPEPCRVATIAIGYGDGYRRHLSGTAQVELSGTRCRVVGAITMDMTMVDVSDVPCEIGDVATLLGGTGQACIGLNELAACGPLSPYELLVGLRLRLSHTYPDSQHSHHT